MTDAAIHNRLSDEECDAYARDGFVTPSQPLPDQLFKALHQNVDRLIAGNPSHRPEQIVCPHILRGADGSLAEDTALRDFFLDLCHHEDIVGMVSQLIGQDVILWGSQLFCKPPRDGLAIPWHQDGHYWPIEPLAACSVWIAVDEASAENGCMRVVPGSHRRGLLAHEKDADPDLALNEALSRGTFDADAAVDVTLRPGQISLHDVNLVHGSEANRSSKRRAGMVLRYMPATSKFNRDFDDQIMTNGARIHFAERPIWLVHGENQHSDNSLVRRR